MAEISSELYRLSARQAVGLLTSGEVSPLDLVDAAAERINTTDNQINALPTLCLDRARAHARAIMDGKQSRGLLGGLPIAVKDLNDVAGVRTTYGSPIYADHIPQRSDILVERLEQQGAIVIGKSNTPEFGAGASTFNEVFGKTRNPWHTGKSVAGSSGGSAATLAAGQVWLATGSDLGGSLRTPASFNSVIGLRPSPGRVIHGPGEFPWNGLPVNGPMARTVADVALFLDAMTGLHAEDPLSLPAPGQSFVAAVDSATPPSRIAFSPNLGIVPVDRQVIAICEAAANRFTAMGTTVEADCPDFSEAIDTFQTLRAVIFAFSHQDHLRQHRDRLKPEVIWNIEKGLALTAAEIGRAEQARARLYHNVVAFFKNYDLLLCPTAIVPPFDVDMRYVEEVEGHKFDNYIHWISITFALTLTGCPVVSVPAGFTADGLPVGLQIMGPPRGDAQVLAAAALLEQATGICTQLPIDPRPGTV
jgi:amidase